jgi:hypothetical protein
MAIVHLSDTDILVELVHYLSYMTLQELPLFLYSSYWLTIYLVILFCIVLKETYIL